MYDSVLQIMSVEFDVCPGRIVSNMSFEFLQ